jgi:hypothetical protein
MKKLFGSLAFALVWIASQPIIIYAQSGGTTHTAASCLASDVNKVINGPTYTAVDGDTILVPVSASMCSSGSPATWAASGSTAALNITKNITLNLQGAYINLAGTSGSQAIVVHPTSTAGTNFILENFNFNNTTSTGVGGGQIFVNTGLPGSSSTQPYRITAGTWTDAGAPTSGIFFNHGGVGPGVVDHITWTATHGADEVIHNTGCGPSVFTCWQDDLTPGGPNFLFVETNTFTNTSSVQVSAIENFDGARTVWRYNTINGGAGGMQFDAHGSGGSGPCTGHGVENSARWWEAYGNTIASGQAFTLRGGSGVIFNNTDSVNPGNIGFTEDCTSGTYPINGQVGRGIATTSGQGGDTRSPAYSWGNSSNMVNFSGNPTFVQVGTAVSDPTNCSANPSDDCDAIYTSTQPATLLKCETAADMIAGCPVSYTYTPYTYPHPLEGGLESFSPSPEQFGVELVTNTSKNAPIYFTYTGNETLTLTGLAPAPTPNFSINRTGLTKPPCNVGTMLTQQSPQCEFNVTFSPGETLGTITGDVMATFTGDPNSPSLQLPLQGTGTEVTLSPKTLAFGTVLSGHKDLSTTVTNKGTTPLQIDMSMSSVTGYPIFQILPYSAGPPVDSTCLNGTVVNQNQTCTFTVRFMSTSGGVTYNEMLSISDNDGASPQTVSITAKD